MPPVAARYLVDFLQDLGWSSSTGMGSTQLSCAEIMAWQQGTNTPLEPWEFSLIREASLAYVIQLYSDDGTPPYSEQPYMKPVTAGAFRALAERFRKK